MKVERVLERVGDPRRLRQAWRQVQRNAGAAGIDRMTVGEFESRQDELLGLMAEKPRNVGYRSKPPIVAPPPRAIFWTTTLPDLRN